MLELISLEDRRYYRLAANRLDIKVITRAEEGDYYKTDSGKTARVPKGKVLVEILGPGDLTVFWELVKLLRSDEGGR